MSEFTTSRRTTIKDVAQAAGVSVTTVSNVLNGRADAMSPETLAHIQAVISALNYHPNSLARSLVTGRAATIALLIAEIETPLFLQAVSTIEPLAREAGYSVIICSARGIDDEHQALDLLREKRVDGIIFLSTSLYAEDDHLLQLQKSGMPMVLINRTTKHDCFVQIDWDNAGGVASAVKHLASLGHERIAHLRGPINRRSSEERLRGYKLALDQAGLPFNQEWVYLCDYEAPQEAWRRTVRTLLGRKPRPTAIIGSDDIVAAVAMSEVQRNGLRVPDDVAIVGVDDQPFCLYVNPSLSTVKLPIAEAGRQAMSLLLERIGAESPGTERILLPCPLVVRDSCGGLRADAQNRPKQPPQQAAFW
jgi:LacI family transcriptional regulator